MFRQTTTSLIRKKSSTVANEAPVERFSARWSPSFTFTRGRRKEVDYKDAYVIQGFIKDKHVHDIQSLNFNGMYKEELNIERSRHPNTSKALTIGTNGSLSEREFEFLVPPIVGMYNDRSYAHRGRVVQLGKIGKLKSRGSWTYTKAPELPELESCNALEFPYCVPRKIPVRNPVADPLNTLAAKVILPPEEDPLNDTDRA